MERNISADAITLNLPTKFIGRKIFYYPSVPSTMDLAREEARRGAAEGLVILADEQTAGRGRLRRAWLSPGGSLALSLVLHPRMERLPFLVMAASLAVVHSIKAVTDLDARIKWPNDVLLGNKKVSGILIENSIQKQTVAYSIIGIGVNVNVKVAGYPGLAPIATSLSDELGNDVPRLELLRSLLVEMERVYGSTDEAIFHEWQERLATLGKKVTVTSATAGFEGVAESVNGDGTLNVRQTDGGLIKVVAGDCTLRNL